MEHPERLESDDMTLRDPRAQEYLRSLERTNPDFAQKAEAFNKEAGSTLFWDVDSLVKRFREDEGEYKNFLDWINSR